MSTKRWPRGGGVVDDTAFLEASAYVEGTSTVGKWSYLGKGVFVAAGVTIGDNCIICDRVRVTADVPDNTTIACDCCSGGGGGDSVLQFDSINLVGSKLADYDTSGKTKGTLAYVGNDSFAGQNSVQDYFTLVYGEALTPDGLTIVNSPTFGADGAQWKRLNTVNQRWIRETNWYVDPASFIGTASDENTGLTPDFPLASYGELNRRILGCAYDFEVIIHTNSDVTGAAYEPLSNAVVNAGGTLLLLSSSVQLSTLTPTYTNKVPASNDVTQLNGDGAGALAVGSLLLQDTDNASAFVMRTGLEGDTCQITQPRASNGPTGDPGGPTVFAGGQLNVTQQRVIGGYPFQGARGTHFIVSGAILDNGGNDQNIASHGTRFINTTFKGAGRWLGGKGVVAQACFDADGCTMLDGDWNLFSCGNTGILEFDGGAVAMNNDHFNAGQINLVGMNAVAPAVDIAVEATAGAIICSNKGNLLQSNGGTLYGQANSGGILVVPAGSQCSLTKAGATATTSAPNPLSVDGAFHPYADIPIAVATSFTGINDQ